MNKLLAKIAMVAIVISPFALPVVTQAATTWDTTGSYVFAFNLGSDYFHNVTLAQDGAGNLTGGGTSGSYAWTITSGSVVGNAIDFYANYTATADAVVPLTTMHVTGTIASDGTMSGTWSDNYQAGVRSGTFMTTNGVVVKTSLDIVVTTENFNTNKGTDYWGVATGYRLDGADADKVASVSVSLYDSSNNLLVTNTSKSAAKVNNTTQGPQYSSAFIVKAGTYSSSSTWNFGAWSPKINVVPAKMVVVVTDINGKTYTVENSSFQASEPSHPTWESLFTGVLSAEDFGVVNYDTGLGMLKGYTAGFGLADATFAGATSVVVKLYAAGDVLLQTNTAILPKFNADITGTQFSSPFDVSGNFNYVADGYWTNVRETQYGQSVPAVKVVATVTLSNGMVVTATNSLLTGDPTTIYPIVVPVPTDKDQCKKDGFKNFIDPRTGMTFRNQGQCVSFTNHN